MITSRFLAALLLLVVSNSPSFAAMWNCTAEARNSKDPSAIGKACDKSRSRSEADAISECKEYGANAGKVCYIVECYYDKTDCS